MNLNILLRVPTKIGSRKARRGIVDFGASVAKSNLEITWTIRDDASAREDLCEGLLGLKIRLRPFQSDLFVGATPRVGPKIGKYGDDLVSINPLEEGQGVSAGVDRD